MLEPLESGKLHIGDAREDHTEASIISLRRYIAMNKAIVERNGLARPERSPLAFISTGARNALTGAARCSLFVRIDLPTESRLIVLMRDLEGLSEKLTTAVAGIAHEARRVAIAARELDLEYDLRSDL